MHHPVGGFSSPAIHPETHHLLRVVQRLTLILTDYPPLFPQRSSFFFFSSLLATWFFLFRTRLMRVYLLEPTVSTTEVGYHHQSFIYFGYQTVVSLCLCCVFGVRKLCVSLSLSRSAFSSQRLSGMLCMISLLRGRMNTVDMLGLLSRLRADGSTTRALSAWLMHSE